MMRLLTSAIALVLSASLVAGCPRSPAPLGYKVKQEDYPQFPRGSWVIVHYGTGDGEISGELIAVEEGGFFLSQQARQPRHIGDLSFIKWEHARQVDVYAHDSEPGGVVAWTILGSLSTISHGFFLIFTAPIWIISGSVSSAMMFRAGRYKHKAKDRAKLFSYARFPQGLPASWRAPRTGPPGRPGTPVESAPKAEPPPAAPPKAPPPPPPPPQPEPEPPPGLDSETPD